MATLALGALGATAGASLLPGGLSLLGLSGAAIGNQIGALAGSMIDQALFGSAGRRKAVDGPRLADLRVTGSTEGAAIPRLYGRARIGGQLIWATALEEEAVERSAAGGGKGSRGSASAGMDYAYYANIAIGLCEGEISALGRVWADGREIDISRFTTRLYVGSEDQAPDPLIEGKQGGDAPAYRGLAYIVFDRLPLAEFGNRIPQFSFEVSRPVDTLEQDIKGVVLIPGSGEFVYAPEPVARRVGRISEVGENTHTAQGGTDWTVSLDQLQAHLPNASSVSLVVSWFGDDLRAAHCKLQPRVERADKDTSIQWSVAGLTRESAPVVSQHDGRPAYGGTPSDASVVAAIQDLKQRGLSVVFSPFVLMDVPSANTLADPYSASSSQPAYPWRGRITVAPAAGLAGTPDKTAAAATQIASFVGTAAPGQFGVSGSTVTYTGPAEWSFRRFILHYAHLCKAAGGVDAFVLCSELRGLSTVRSGVSTYPFVAALQQLATEVRAILGPQTKITYGADWSEYFGHHPADTSGDAHFHLDPLWASPAIDAVGVDVYWPLADWRDGGDHLDALGGVQSIHELGYLKSNLAGGEGYDWYYASAADRAQQIRTPITDGLGKPWMFRFKDLKSWWSQPHRNRIGGVEQASPTAWVPQSKPFWLLEIGCPAVDKGANQPNVFIDAKSGESALPHFSSGDNDDHMQRRVLQAFVEAFDPTSPGFVATLNPMSTLDGRRMVDPARIHVYAWDARPFPAFPDRTEIWGDGPNWRLGHWINGRAASAPVPALIGRLLDDHDFSAYDVSQLGGTIGGLVLDRTMSAREALSSLELVQFIDAVESGERIHFRGRAQSPIVATVNSDAVVETRSDADLIRRTRGQETDLPAAVTLNFISSSGDYPAAVVEARRGAGFSTRIAGASLGLVLDPASAQSAAESWLHETWIAREQVTFSMPPRYLAVEPGDLVSVATDGGARLYRITDVSDRGLREIEARAVEPSTYRRVPGPTRAERRPRDVPTGPPLTVLLDCPPGVGEPAHAGLVAAAQAPWPGSVAVYRSSETSNYALSTVLPRAATTGRTTSALAGGPAGRFDYGSSLTVQIDRGALTSASTLALLGGANLAAVEVAPGVWEAFQFGSASLLAPATYRLTVLLRGQRGTDALMAPTIASGARFVLLDSAVRAVDMTLDDIGLTYNWRIGPARDDIGASSYRTTEAAFTGAGLKPYAPAHVRGRRDAGGTLVITWIRRTRTGGDGWETDDVPLGESSERYVVDIMAGVATVRTFEVTAPQVTYTAAQQMLDFGSLQTAVTVRVAQVNPDFGRGHARTASL